jgi:hypothetical protein
MNVFLTWSGTVSHKVAIALREWLPLVLQRVRPFLSSEDIRKGSRWATEIAQGLAKVEYAIVCLTPTNLESQWVHFEAGAVSKHLEIARVAVLLVDLKPTDVEGPLAQFHHTNTTRDDMLKLTQDLNAASGPDQLTTPQVEKSFSAFWDDLEKQIEEAKKYVSPRPHKRSNEDLLAEILESSRNQGRTMGEWMDLQKHIMRDISRLAHRRVQTGPRHDFNWKLGDFGDKVPLKVSDEDLTQLGNMLAHDFTKHPMSADELLQAIRRERRRRAHPSSKQEEEEEIDAAPAPLDESADKPPKL